MKYAILCIGLAAALAALLGLDLIPRGKPAKLAEHMLHIFAVLGVVLAFLECFAVPKRHSRR